MENGLFLLPESLVKFAFTPSPSFSTPSVYRRFGVKANFYFAFTSFVCLHRLHFLILLFDFVHWNIKKGDVLRVKAILSGEGNSKNCLHQQSVDNKWDVVLVKAVKAKGNT